MTQTAIPQAAIAWVSRYLIEREPVVLHPDYYAEHNPKDVEEMIALHGELHGQACWRDLLWMTMKEIIAEPNYAPADLKKVARPTLVIMGEKDMVNARWMNTRNTSPGISPTLSCGFHRA